MTAINRRLTPRVSLRRELTFSHATHARTAGLLLDLSLGGAAILRLDDSASIDPARDLHIATELPTPNGAEEFAAQCRVASVNPLTQHSGAIVGLEFINLQPKHRQVLAQFLRLSYQEGLG